MLLADPETFLEAGETFLGAGETFLGEEETFLDEGEMFLEQGESFLKGRETFLTEPESYLGCPEMFLGMAEWFRNGGRCRRGDRPDVTLRRLPLPTRRATLRVFGDAHDVPDVDRFLCPVVVFVVGVEGDRDVLAVLAEHQEVRMFDDEGAGVGQVQLEGLEWLGAEETGQLVLLHRHSVASRHRRPIAGTWTTPSTAFATETCFTLCVIALLALGVVMVQSASTNLGDLTAWHLSDRGEKHALFAVLSLLTFITVSRLDYRKLAGPADDAAWLKAPAVWVVVAAVALNLAVLMPGVGSVVNGARRWIAVGPVRIQPSECAKWATVLFLAWRLSRPNVGQSFSTGFVPTCAVVGGLCLLVVVEDFGTAALIGVAAFSMLLAGPTKLWHLALTVPPAAMAAIGFVAMEPYRLRRMTAFLDPWASPETDGYHMIQSLYSFAGGGLTGRGLGNGVQKLGYLPEDTTDFIFAVISEELGLFGAILVVVIYLTILAVGWSAARKATDAFGRLLCFGVVAMLGLQASINIAVATASVPTKGMSLPLVSAGGSGLIITAAMLGLVYSVCRGEDAAEVPAC